MPSSGNIDLRIRTYADLITTRVVIINQVEKSEEWAWGGCEDAEVWTNQLQLVSREGVWVSHWEEVHTELMEAPDIELMIRALKALGATEQEAEEILRPLRSYLNRLKS